MGVYGGTRIEIANTTINTWADGVYANNGSTSDWVNGLWVHDNTFTYIGRNAFTMNGVRNALLDRNTIDQVGASVLDIEPTLNTQGVANVTLSNNRVGTWGLSNWGTLYFVACAQPAGGVAVHRERPDDHGERRDRWSSLGIVQCEQGRALHLDRQAEPTVQRHLHEQHDDQGRNRTSPQILSMSTG